MNWIIQIVCSFIATMGIAVIFNAPRRSLINCGVVGSIGWMIYYILIDKSVDEVPASFAGAFVVAIVAHIFATHFKMPMIIFSIAGIIPLVPGGMAYEAMRSMVANNYIASLEYATRAGILTGVIVMGLVFADVFFKLIRLFKYRFKI